MVDEMPLGGYALGGFLLGGKTPAKKNKKLVHQGNEKVADLKKKAKALGIKGYSKMRKFELLKVVGENNKSRHMVEMEKKPKKNVKRSAKKTAENLSNKEFSEILQLGDILKMKLAELKKKIKC
jgi:hypothetical protein